MIRISLSGDFLPEKSYIFNILLGEFLQIPFEIQVNDHEGYEMRLPNGKMIRIEDHFFKFFDERSGYLVREAIPKNATWTNFGNLAEEKIPILFGRDACSISDSEIAFSQDLVSTCFFMLTRWEELVISERDEFGRFKSSEALAVKFDFIERPIVCELTIVLRTALNHLDYDADKQRFTYTQLVTFDIDDYLRFPNWYSGVKSVIGDVAVRGSLKMAADSTKAYFQHLIKKKDPYDTFDWIFSTLSDHNLSSRFYLLLGGFYSKAKKAVIPEKKVRETSDTLRQRGIPTGLHPSYNTKDSVKVLQKEIAKFSELMGYAPAFCRQHFLRIEVPKTWQLQEECGLKSDSSMYYPESPGFRTGSCYPYSVFDLENRKMLGLQEETIVFAEFTWLHYLNTAEPLEIEDTYRRLRRQCEKVNGHFISLWHNSSVFNPRFSLSKAISL